MIQLFGVVTERVTPEGQEGFVVLVRFLRGASGLTTGPARRSLLCFNNMN
jgi:hypothetical protein